MSKILTDEEKFKKLNGYTTDFIGIVEALDDKAKVIIMIESPSGLSLLSGSSGMSTGDVLGHMRLFTIRAEQQEVISYNKRVFVQDQILEEMRNRIASNSLNKGFKAN